MSIPSADIADFWFLVRKSASLMDRAGEALFREVLDISLPQFMVLSVIDAHPGTFNQQDVADLLGLTKGTVSRQIEIARSAGLLTAEVSANSRREKSIALTPAGTELVRRGDQILNETNVTLFPEFDPADMAGTLRTLTMFTRSMDSHSNPPSSHGVGQDDA
jgi:DNA-binding MarR family transcriptional regulator